MATPQQLQTSIKGVDLLRAQNTTNSSALSNFVYIYNIMFVRRQHRIRRKPALSGNGKTSFNPILDSNADPDYNKNLIITGWTVVQALC